MKHMMTRRKFIRNGALFVPAIGVLPQLLSAPSGKNFQPRVQATNSLAASGGFSPADTNPSFTLDTGTLAGMSNGADVNTFTDAFNPANSATPVGTAPKKQTVNGVPVCRFAGSDRLVTNSFLDASFDTDMTVMFVAKATTMGATNTLLSHNDLAFAFLESTTGGYRTNLWQGVSDHVYSVGNVCCFRYDGTNFRSSRNIAAVQTLAKTDALGLSGALTIGARSTGASQFVGDFVCVYIWNRALSDTERNSMVSYLATRHAGFAGQDTIIIFGDSQMTAFGGTIPTSTMIKTHIDGESTPYIYYYVNATAGWTTRQAIDSFQTIVTDRIGGPQLGSRNIVCSWFGGNNLDTALADQDEFAAMLRADNADQVVGQIMPRFDNTQQEEDWRAEFNGNLVAQEGVLWSKVVRTTDSVPLESPTDLTYWDADGVHLNDTGKQIPADLFADKINPW